MSTVHQLLQLLSPHRRLLLLLIVVATLVVATESLGLGIVFLLLTAQEAYTLGLDLPWLNERMQTVIGLSITTRIYISAGVLVGITLVRSSLQYTEQLLSLRLRRQVEGSLQQQLFCRFHEFSLELLQRERHGAWMALLGQHTRRVGSLILQFGQAISNTVILIGYIGVAFFISWYLTLFSLLLLLPTSLLLRPLIGSRLRVASRLTRDLMKETQSVAQEQLHAMKIIRSFGREAWSQATYQQHLDRYLVQEYRTAALATLARPLFAVLNVLILAAVLLLGVTFLPGSPETVLAQLAIFLTIAFRLTGPIGILARFHTQVTEAAPMLQEIMATIEADYPLAPRSGLQLFPGLRHDIQFKDVSFAYSSENASEQTTKQVAQEVMVLRNVNLHILPRQITAIVGASGGGKSSLVNLLVRLYDPTEGQILVDGTDLRLFDLTAWHQKVAVVSQGVNLFHTSVWENLRFARADATDAEVVQAAKLAHAHDFILELPQGYNTLLQEEGLRLSGGQRQRIALARALLMEADLLILDEATSELDALTEQAIQQTIREYAQERTVLIIAHRLSNVVHADHIYVMNEGGILEEGTHLELLHNHSLYAQMVEAQRV